MPLKQKALFLDRDGIINIDHGYVSQIKDFQFTQGIFELLHLFLKKNYLLFIVTNQSGIGRGYYTLDNFHTLNDWMLERLKEKQIPIESVHYCPHAPEESCLCRKPQTGMVDDILQNHSIDLLQSWLIGDKQSDIDLATHAHIPNTIAIGTHKITDAKYQFDTISEALNFIKKEQESLL